MLIIYFDEAILFSLKILYLYEVLIMYGRITSIGEEATTILTEENRVIKVNSLFLPLQFKSGDMVELEEDKIVLR
ncbi:MAG: hypothetical protein K0R09_2007 [Clostridiales bacterium]|jgi:hypothetical protein|nr:hypothetical protein [Clostridiales bacterium]